jgi:hypothetical protein
MEILIGAGEESDQARRKTIMELLVAAAAVANMLRVRGSDMDRLIPPLELIKLRYVPVASIRRSGSPGRAWCGSVRSRRQASEPCSFRSGV